MTNEVNSFGNPRPSKLTRSASNRMVGGVCAGVAEHFNWDPTAVRLACIVACAFGGGGVLAYLIAWAVMPAPEAPSEGRWGQSQRPGNDPNQNGSDSFDLYGD